MVSRLVFTAALVLLVTGCFAPGASAGPTVESVGKSIYFDTNLSNPRVQSCASCHHPTAGFADPDTGLPVSQGAVPSRFGDRNSPTASYAMFIPPRTYDATLGTYVGGQFWDGRSDTLEAQAKGPFLNPLEMNMPNRRAVVKRVANSAYASDFKAVFGPRSLSLKNVARAYDRIARAIAAYERTEEVNPFSSKYDAVLAGTASFTSAEQKGMELFNGKASCSTCHVNSGMDASAGPSVFSDYRYVNLGVPKNWESPFLTIAPRFNPAGLAYVDHGLADDLEGGVEANAEFDGMFRTPALRNVGLTPPYGHNGYFTSLKQVIHFKNTRDVAAAGWPEPEVPHNLTMMVGDLGLSDAEEDQLVAFLHTLSDLTLR